MTTQFTEVGDRMLSVADGGSGWLSGGGSFVSYVAPRGDDVSIVLETTKTGLSNHWFSCRPAGPKLLPSNQSVRVRLPPPLLEIALTKGLALWESSATASFVRRSRNVSFSDGNVALMLRPDSIYTLSTRSGQFQMAAGSRPSMPLALPYLDSFDTTKAGGTPRYGYSGAGAFEVVPCGPAGAGGNTTCGPSSKAPNGHAIRQMVLRPLEQNGWHGKGDNLPAWVVGSVLWSNYSVSVDALLEATGVAGTNASACNVQLCARVPSGCYLASASDPLRGVCLELSLHGVRLLHDGIGLGTAVRLPTQPGQWRTLALQVLGTSVSAQVDGRRVLGARVESAAAGRVGLSSGFHGAVFDNLAVTNGAGRLWQP